MLNRIWLVPVDKEGREGEPQEVTVAQGITWGLTEGYEEGSTEDWDRLEGWEWGKWSVELTFEREEAEELIAALFGMSVSEYRDWLRWSREVEMLRALTGLGWWGDAS